jgi:hypothetical protein
MPNAGKDPVKMTAAKRKQLEEAGWTVGSTANFLQLSPDEQAIIEIRLETRLAR